MDQLPPMMDYNIRHGHTYMYFQGEPLYPFGFGLSYTSFRYSNLKTSSALLASDGTLQVSLDVTKVGQLAGDEVVQLYVKHPHSKVERQGKELKGFRRVSLESGQTRPWRFQSKLPRSLIGMRRQADSKRSRGRWI